MRSILLSVILVVVTETFLSAQPHVRQDDHFWRKRIVNRISLVEKVNKPLVLHASSYYSENSTYPETEGMIASLINGLKQGKYIAYHPEDWRQTLNYEDLIKRMEEFDKALQPVEEDDWDDTELEFNEVIDEWEGDWKVEESAAEKDWANPFGEDPGVNGSNQTEEQEMDLAAYEEVIHMVEDWVFDKTRSDMVQQIDFFEVIWSDPLGTLPEKVLARFKWQDVKEQLDQTMWNSRFNDAQARSIAEIFELRIFNSILIDVGGVPVRSLQEAERRRQEIIEFEHHLWSY